MAANEIKIIVGGDPSGFTRAAKEASTATERMRNTLRDAAGAIPALNNTANAVSTTLQRNVVPGANQAAAALTNVGRVAQDLPFGFVGIQNNLNPLLESFQRLKAETGSSKEAFKALGSSLIGAGGIGLALSVVSSAILIFQNGIAGFSSKTKEAKEKADELAKSIRSIGLVQQEATAGVEGQVAQVAALSQVVSDSNKPYEQRKRALEELKDVNKAYFDDLKIEDAATGKLTKTVDEYTKALINNAIQKGFVDEIADVAKAVAKQDDIIAKSRLKLAQAQKAVKDAENFLPTATRDPETAKQKKREEAGRKEAEALAELRAENEKVTQLLTQEALLRDQLNRAVLEGTKFKDLDADKGKKEEDLLKKRLEALEKIKDATKDATTRVGLQEAIFELQVKITLRDAAKNNLSKQEIDQAIQGFQRELNEEFKKQAVELEAIPKVTFSPTTRLEINDIISKVFTSKEKIKLSIGEKGVEVDLKTESVDVTDLQGKVAKAVGLDKKIVIPTQFEIDLKFNGKDFADSAERARQQIQGIKDALINGIVNGIQQGAALIGEAFGNILSGGDVGSSLAKAAEGLLSIVGDILQQVGKEIIITSQLVATLKQAINNLFKPGGEAVGIAVGAALIASGALLKNIKFDVPKLAQGGIATSATLGIFGEAGKEAIIPLDKLPEILGRINVNNQNDVALAPTLRISLTDLELGLERVRSRRRRLG